MTQQQDGWYLASDGRWYPSPPGFGPPTDPYASTPYGSGAGAPASRSWVAWAVVAAVVVIGLAVGTVLLFFSFVNDRQQAFVEGRQFPVEASPWPEYPEVEVPAMDPADWQGKVGQPGTLTRDYRTADLVTVTAVRSSTAAKGLPRPRNGRYLVVSVTFDGTDALDVHPYDFVVRMPDVRLFRSDAGTADSSTLDDVLHEEPVLSGAKLSGQLMFDVPPGHGMVVYTPFPNTSFAWTY